jgi:putative MATE family efflux protein
VSSTAVRERILHGPILPTLVRLAWPVLVSMSLHTCFNIVNAFWVGRLGPAALAAVTTSLFATWSLWAFAEMVGVGLVATVSRHVGAGEHARADHAAAQGILLASLLAAIAAALGGIVPRWLFHVLRTEPEVAREGIVFLEAIFLGAAAFFLLFTLEAILRAWGDTRTPMRITSLVVALNIVLDPLLIFGVGPFPRLGTLGAGIATVAAHSIGVALMIRHFTVHRARFPGIPRNLLRVDPAAMFRLLRIGAPISLNMILFSLVYLFLSREAAAIGTGPLAALGVGNRIESISYLTASSLSVAAATMVGQNLGAASPDRARAVAAASVRLAIGVCSFWGFVFYVFARPLLTIFSSDAQVIGPGITFLRLLAICQPMMGLEIALSGVFQGAGYTLLPMSISSTISVLRIPLARFAVGTAGLGLQGIGWVIAVTCMLRGACMLLVMRTGRWARVRSRG